MKIKSVISMFITLIFIMLFSVSGFASQNDFNNEIHTHHVEANIENGFEICPDCNIKVYECKHCGTFNALENRYCEYCQNKREAIYLSEKREDYRKNTALEFILIIIFGLIGVGFL